jgi:hypothetical protein
VPSEIQPSDKPTAEANGKAWFVGPAAAKINFFIGLFGIAFAVFTYWQTRLSPELTVSQQPVQTTIARSGELSRMTVHYDGRELKSDINATQVAIWNGGNKPILPADVLDSVLLSLDAPAEILEVSVRRVSRQVVSPTVAVVGVAKRFVHFGFKILEPDDGVIIQITYSGKQGARVRATANVLGQSAIRIANDVSATPQNATADTRTSRFVTRTLFFILLSFLILLSGFATYGTATSGLLARKEKPARRAKDIGQFLFFLAFFVLAVLALFGLLSKSLGPPFPF